MRAAVAVLAAACLVAPVLFAAPASAGPICVVNDPTDTPLNVRAAPRGAVLGTLADGVEVEIIDTATDARGSTWVRVRPPGASQVYGWVFRNYLFCR